MLDNVYLNGERLPHTNLTPTSIGLSALLDTGNSDIRGPLDVIEQITQRIFGVNSTSYNCSPHTLAFEFGGKLFPVDPRDLVSQDTRDSSKTTADNSPLCTLNLDVNGDLPTNNTNDYLYSWKLGSPFLRSVLAAFYYGDIDQPASDPPRIGLLSTVPPDVENAMDDAIQKAEVSGGTFPLLSEPAPTNTYTSLATGVSGVPLAPTVTSTTQSSSAGFALLMPSLKLQLFSFMFCLLLSTIFS